AGAQLFYVAVLDRLRGARLRAGRCLAVGEPVVAEGALLGDTDLRVALRALAAVDDTVRAGGHAVSATVADVVLHDHRAELAAEQRAGRAHVEARRVGAVL